MLRAASVRLEVRSDHAAEGVDRCAVAVDEDGEVAGADVGGGHDGRAGSDVRRKQTGVAEEQHVTSEPWVGRRLGQELGVRGVVGDHHRVRPGPDARDAPDGAFQRWGLGAEEGEDAARTEGNEPRPLVVVADGEDDGDIGRREVGRTELVVSHLPSRATRDSCEPCGRLAVRSLQPEGHGLGADLHRANDRRGAPVGQRPTQHAIGRLEGLERRHLVETAQEGGGINGTIGFGPAQVEVVAEGLGLLTPPSSPSKCGTGE